jgi:hypothetical protein
MKPRALSLFALVLALLAGPAGAAVLRPDGSVDWTRYHDSAEAETLLREIVAKYPDLARMYSIGRSLKGKELWVLELTNRRTRPAEEKPGYYVDGGIHACELTGAEQVLYLAWYFSAKYGKEAEVTRLLDTRALYLRPKFNPDGADYCMTHPDSLRSTVRPWDDDGDGPLDEDPAEDLDGDGAITQMRVKSPHGTHKVSSEDPRIMVERKLGEAGGEYYLLLSEGTDNDGDGQFNEDGVGGIDMNRNFPRTWGLPYQQSGAGPFPLSEPETRATLDFLIAHPNVTGIVHNHTSGGFLYRLPSTNPASDHEADDLALVKQFGDEYTRVTGHEVHDSYAGEGASRHGTLISWGYFDFGVIGWVPEHWGGFGKDYDGDKRVSERERLRWNDEELGGSGFTPWKTFSHPQLGPVEIGGWKRKFTQQNPPPKLLEKEIAMKVPWFVYIANSAPLLRLVDARATALGGGLYRIDAAVENEGYLPTNVTQRAIKAELAKPVRARLKPKNAEVADGSAVQALGDIPGTRALRGGSGGFGGGRPAANRREVSWVVKAKTPDAAVEVEIWSEKAGTERRTIALK